MTDLDKMLASAAPEQLASDPIMRAAFIVGLMAADIFIPVMAVSYTHLTLPTKRIV